MSISVLFCWLQGRCILYINLKRQVAEEIKVKVRLSSVTMFSLTFSPITEHVALLDNSDNIITL